MVVVTYSAIPIISNSNSLTTYLNSGTNKRGII